MVVRQAGCMGLFAARLLPVVVLLIAAMAGACRADDGSLCRSAIGVAEESEHIPDAFLAAIARVESGRADQQTGGLVAWPWTINAEGVGSFFDTKAEAVSAVRALQARGVRSIDVGCLQVNLMHHPEAFGSIEQAFDPGANASYAGRFLLTLFAKVGSWPLAAAAYHSQTPTIGAAYQRKVLAEWAVPDGSGQQRQASQAPAGKGKWPHNAPGAREKPSVAAVAVPPGAVAAIAQNAGTAPVFGHMAAAVPHGAPAGGILFTGRSLAAYRLIPTALALRPPRKSG
jgi:hypothetical protein